MTPPTQSQHDKIGRRRLWAVLAWVLVALILATAMLPGRRSDWSRAAILFLLLALASEWLVLRRLYQHEDSRGARHNAVKVIMSVLLVISAIILAISSTRR